MEDLGEGLHVLDDGEKQVEVGLPALLLDLPHEIAQAGENAVDVVVLEPDRLQRMEHDWQTSGRLADGP